MVRGQAPLYTLHVDYKIESLHRVVLPSPPAQTWKWRSVPQASRLDHAHTLGSSQLTPVPASTTPQALTLPGRTFSPDPFLCKLSGQTSCPAFIVYQVPSPTVP